MPTQVLTRTDGSAGRVKEDIRPVISLVHEVPAAEWNAIAQAVTEMSAEVGASAAPAGSSLLMLRSTARSIYDPEYTFVNDYVEPSAGVTDVSIVGTASRSYDGAGPGLGSLVLTVANVASSEIVAGHVGAAPFRPGHLPIWRYRFTTPSNPTQCAFYIGPANAANTRCARLGWNGSALSFDRTFNGGSNSTAIPAGISGDKTYSLEIRLLATGCQLYLDGVLVAQGADVPDASEAFGAGIYRMARISGGPHTMRVDYVHVSGTRS